ncbi:MAG: ThiF family adenylyltransferase [Campylobacterales bacterium]|nr:ThiF family adenylyltransferase [Campylobacterales bacterium]
MNDFNAYFNRQIQLWGEDTQNSLQDKKIAIIGCGGLGCSIGIALGASGIGQIDLVDFDEVGVHNIHRQIGFVVGDEGKKKCDVLKKLLQNRCPYVRVNSFDSDFDTFTTQTTMKYDLILDATDNLTVRAMINSYAKQNNINWIYGSVEQFHGQVCFFENASFESIFQISDHTPAGITAPIVMHIASLQANLALRFLAGLSVVKDKLYYLSFNSDGELDTKKFNLPKQEL